LMGIPRTLISAPSGYMAESLGWTEFFIICTLIALPGLWLLRHFSDWHSHSEQNETDPQAPEPKNSPTEKRDQSHHSGKRRAVTLEELNQITRTNPNFNKSASADTKESQA
ncbi:hypothetical protein ABMA58_03425, partial [Oceanospirillum sp. HFRX-1_2]